MEEIKYKLWEISFNKEVGLIRFFFIFSTFLSTISSLLYIFVPFLRSNFFNTIYFIPSYLLILLLSYLIFRYFLPEYNISWLELKRLGENKFHFLDMILIISSIIMLLIAILIKKSLFFSFIFSISAISILLNFKSKKDSHYRVNLPSLPDFPAPILPDKPDEQSIKRTYSWTSELGNFSFSFSFLQSEYENAQENNKNQINKFPNGPWPKDYYTEKVYNGLIENIKQFITTMVNVINKSSGSNNSSFSFIKYLDSFLQFVHTPNIEYSEDKKTTGYIEYARYPIETLVEKTGDCEDHAILLAAIYKFLGYKVCLISLTNHILTGVEIPEYIKVSFNKIENNGVFYIPCETTGSSWKIGQMPQSEPNMSILEIN